MSDGAGSELEGPEAATSAPARKAESSAGGDGAINRQRRTVRHLGRRVVSEPRRERAFGCPPTRENRHPGAPPPPGLATARPVVRAGPRGRP